MESPIKRRRVKSQQLYYTEKKCLFSVSMLPINESLPLPYFLSFQRSVVTAPVPHLD